MLLCKILGLSLCAIMHDAQSLAIMNIFDQTALMSLVQDANHQALKKLDPEGPEGKVARYHGLRSDDFR